MITHITRNGFIFFLPALLYFCCYFVLRPVRSRLSVQEGCAVADFTVMMKLLVGYMRNIIVNILHNILRNIHKMWENF